MAASSQPSRPTHHAGGGGFLPYIMLDFSPVGTPITSRDAALSLLRPLAAAAAVPGQGIEAELQHTLLRALLEHGLVEQGGRFGLRSVAKQQARQQGDELDVGEAMLSLLPSVRSDLGAAYRSPGLALADLLAELHDAGLLALGQVHGKQAVHYSACLQWLQPFARRATVPSAPAQQKRRVPLPPPVQPTATRPVAAAGDVQVTLQPNPSSGKPRVSRANAISMLKYRLTLGMQGTTPTAQLQQLVVACLLAEGLEKVDTLSFCQHPVSLKAARKALEQQLRIKGQALQACYRSQFDGSLLALLHSPELAGLVRLQGVLAPAEEGWEQAGSSEQGHVQLLLRPQTAAAGPCSNAAAVPPGPTAGSSAGPAAPYSAVDAAEADFEGWSFAVEEQAGAASTAAAPQAPPLLVPLPQLAAAAPQPVASIRAAAAPQLMASINAATASAAPAAASVAGAPDQVTVQAVSSEHAAGAAVAALLAAPGGRIGMACEASTASRDPSALVISLFAPAGTSAPGSQTSRSGTCHVFDVAAMPPQDRKAALHLLAAVLENEQLIKVVHGCRAASQALFNLPGRSIELRGIWDTQVAHGLAQFLSLLGTEEAADGVDEPAPLHDLLTIYGVPPPSLSLGGGAASQAAHTAAAAATPLLALSAALQASLGPLAAARLPALSRAYSRWDLDLAAYTAVPRPPRQWLAHLLELAPL